MDEHENENENAPHICADCAFRNTIIELVAEFSELRADLDDAAEVAREAIAAARRTFRRAQRTAMSRWMEAVARAFL